MSSRPRILLVAPTLALAKNLFDWLGDAGYDVSLVTSFASAKIQLQSVPQLLISEVRLGEFNGLHLASRAQSMGIPAIVMGEPDAVLERDAQQMNIAYVNAGATRDYLLMLVEQLGPAGRDRRTPGSQVRGTGGSMAFMSSGELMALSVPPRNGRRMH